MIRAICAFVALSLVSSIALGFEVGDVVVVIDDSELEFDGRVVDKLYPGLPLAIEAIDGNQIWLGCMHAGWIDSKHVVPLDQGIARLTALIEQRPDEPLLYVGRALLWDNLKNPGKSLSDCNEAIRLDQNCALAYAHRGPLWAKFGQYKKTMPDLNEAIRIDPQCTWAYVYRATAFAAMRDDEKAQADFDKALVIDPGNTHCLISAALIWSKKGSDDVYREKTIQYATQAIQSDPYILLAYTLRGIARTNKGDFDGAVADSTELIRINPKSAGGYGIRALAWSEMGECKNAIADFDAVLRMNPNPTAEIYGLRGVQLARNGEYEKAIADEEAAIRLIPNGAECHANLAWIYATCPDETYRNGTKAVELARKACELVKWQDAKCLETLAAAYAERGEWTSAIKRQEKAITLAKDEKKQQDCRERLEFYKAEKPYREVLKQAKAETSGRVQ